MCDISKRLFLYHAAPAQPPLNVEWTLIGSQLSLYWEPVVAMESESEVTGYQVSVRFTTAYVLVKEWTFPVIRSKLSGCKKACLQSVTHLVFLSHSAVIQATET